MAFQINMTEEVLNALMAQNNSLAAMVENSEDGTDLERANMQITFVADLWDSLGYGYKLAELRQRVARKANQLAQNESNYISGCRKNDRTINGARMNLLKLQALAS